MDIEVLRDDLVSLRRRFPCGLAGIAFDSGISKSWLDKFVRRKINNPTLKRIVQLQSYLDAKKLRFEDRAA